MLHIVCFGNIWQGDDGFGMHVFQRLCDLQSLPSQVGGVLDVEIDRD